MPVLWGPDPVRPGARFAEALSNMGASQAAAAEATARGYDDFGRSIGAGLDSLGDTAMRYGAYRAERQHREQQEQLESARIDATNKRATMEYLGKLDHESRLRDAAQIEALAKTGNYDIVPEYESTEARNEANRIDSKIQEVQGLPWTDAAKQEAVSALQMEKSRLPFRLRAVQKQSLSPQQRFEANSFTDDRGVTYQATVRNGHESYEPVRFPEPRWMDDPNTPGQKILVGFDKDGNEKVLHAPRPATSSGSGRIAPSIVTAAAQKAETEVLDLFGVNDASQLTPEQRDLASQLAQNYAGIMNAVASQNPQSVSAGSSGASQVLDKLRATTQPAANNKPVETIESSLLSGRYPDDQLQDLPAPIIRTVLPMIGTDDKGQVQGEPGKLYRVRTKDKREVLVRIGPDGKLLVVRDLSGK